MLVGAVKYHFKKWKKKMISRHLGAAVIGFAGAVAGTVVWDYTTCHPSRK